MNKIKNLLIVFLVFASFTSATAFELIHRKSLKDGGFIFYLDFSAGPILLDYYAAFDRAVAHWLSLTDYATLDTRRESIDACEGTNGVNGISSVVFSPDVCGEAFTSFNTLDIGNPIAAAGSFLVFQADTIVVETARIFFRSTVSWNDLEQFENTAIHEIGHTLGLGHSKVSNSVMARQRGAITPDELCGLAMNLGQPEDCDNLLGEGMSSTNELSTAEFVGGVTADGGLTYGTVFAPDVELEIFATVVPEEAHIGQMANIHVVALTEGGQAFARNEQGEFDPLDLTGAIPSAKNLTMFAARDIRIGGVIENKRLNDETQPSTFDPVTGVITIPKIKYFTGELFGLQGQTIRFYIGYSLDSKPSEVFYGAEPITLTWSQ